MMPNNRRQYCTGYRQRRKAEYSETARIHRENNRDEINTGQ